MCVECSQKHEIAQMAQTDHPVANGVFTEAMFGGNCGEYLVDHGIVSLKQSKCEAFATAFQKLDTVNKDAPTGDTEITDEALDILRSTQEDSDMLNEIHRIRNMGRD